MYIKAWILPLDSLVDNHFCTIDNSISLFVLDCSQQYCRHSGGYTVADIYTVADTQGRIQCQIHSTGSRYTFTGVDTQGQRHSSGYTAAETVAYIQQQIQQLIYNTADTMANIQ